MIEGPPAGGPFLLTAPAGAHLWGPFAFANALRNCDALDNADMPL